jgi:hypothetical protein
MRIALTTALLMAAALAFADAPSTPRLDTEAAAEASDKAPAQATAEESTAKAEDSKPFKPPAGYRPKRINGELVYCSKTVPTGSKFPVTDCRNEAQLRDMERSKRAMREDLNRGRACAGGDCSAR